MNPHQLIVILEAHIKEISTLNEFISGRLVHLIRHDSVSQLQNLSMEKEHSLVNDDLLKKICDLHEYKTDPLTIQSLLARYLEALIYLFFEIIKSKEDEKIVHTLFWRVQRQTKDFVEKITKILADPKNMDMKHHYDQYLKSEFYNILKIDYQLPNP